MEKAHKRIGVILVGLVCVWCFCTNNAGAGLPSADLRQLTTGNSCCWNGDWSKDGKWIVYQREKPGQTWRCDIYKIRVDGTEETQLTSGYLCDSKPQFSPDGKKIAFQRNMNPEGGTKVGEKASIWVMNADGSNQTQIVAPGPEDKEGAQWPVWSPDGKFIAYMYGERRKKGLWIIKPDGTGAQQLISSDFGEGIERFTDWKLVDWKPKGPGKGKQIVVSVKNTTPRKDSRSYSRHNALIEFDPKGKTAPKLTWLTDPETAACQWHPQWKPDGKQIVYTDDSNNKADIWLMNPDGTNKVRLTDSASHGNACYSNPDWSPNGKYIVYQSTEGLSGTNKRRIYIMTADGTEQNCLMSDENIRESNRGEFLMHFDRKGTKILFVGKDLVASKYQLFVLDLHK